MDNSKFYMFLFALSMITFALLKIMVMLEDVAAHFGIVY